jgi:hypothetical protein
MRHADVEHRAARAQGLADDADWRYGTMLKNEDHHGLISLPMSSRSDGDETRAPPSGSAGAKRIASGERKRRPAGATTISKSLKGFGQTAGQTNKGRQTS